MHGGGFINWDTVVKFLPERAAGVGMEILGAIVLYVVGRWLISLLLSAVQCVLAKQKIEPTVLRFAGPVLAVRPYRHNDNYWQVYFDTNMVIRAVLGEAAFPGPVYPLAVHQTKAMAAA